MSFPCLCSLMRREAEVLNTVLALEGGKGCLLLAGRALDGLDDAGLPGVDPEGVLVSLDVGRELIDFLFGICFGRPPRWKQLLKQDLRIMLRQKPISSPKEQAGDIVDFLGVNIIYKEDEIHLIQTHLIDKIINKKLREAKLKGK